MLSNILDSHPGEVQLFVSSFNGRLVGGKIMILLVATNAPYSVLMGNFMTADFQFLSLARMGKLFPWGFLPIDGRLVGAKL